MKKFIASFIAVIALACAPYVHAQTLVTQGGTGTTTIPAGQIVVGSSTLRTMSYPALFWDALGQILRVPNASSTALSSMTAAFGGTATSSFDAAGVLSLATPLAITSGGIGASSLTNLITLATHTVGNYLATLTSSGSITVGNSGSENAAATVDLNMAHANTFTALQTFANASSTLFSTAYASSTAWRGGGLTSDCDSDAQGLGWDLTTGMFVCGDDDSGIGGGITTIKEDDGDVVVAATAIDFGSGFAVSANVTEGDISLDLVEYNGAASTTLLSANYASSTNVIAGILSVSTSLALGGDTILDFVGDGFELSAGTLIFDCSDVAGTGITCSGEDITASLGTAITSGEITDGEIVNADVNASAAIVYSKLALANSILNTDFADADLGDVTISGNAAAVEDDSHAHTSGTISGLGTADISGLDISDDTNLAATYPLILTGDTLSTGFGTTTHQIFSSAYFTLASSTNATTTGSQYIGTHHVFDFGEISWTYGSTSQGTGTTTRPVVKVMPRAGTVVEAVCHFNKHMRILAQDEAGNRMNDFIASATEAKNSISTNATFTEDEPLLFYVGTTTASLGNVYGGCTYKYRYN